ncbi:hypothetical protein ACOMHN_061109 [Nucella lapillus]
MTKNSVRGARTLWPSYSGEDTLTSSCRRQWTESLPWTDSRCSATSPNPRHPRDFPSSSPTTPPTGQLAETPHAHATPKQENETGHADTAHRGGKELQEPPCFSNTLSSSSTSSPARSRTRVPEM